ncbi:hypothetical protein EDD85DRAFT_796185 [Armillaria nabsnona]|nr:hypothetical protein EDD85DRAFT_796185 [Armillaria nabsnona]
MSTGIETEIVIPELTKSQVKDIFQALDIQLNTMILFTILHRSVGGKLVVHWFISSASLGLAPLICNHTQFKEKVVYIIWCCWTVWGQSWHVVLVPTICTILGIATLLWCTILIIYRILKISGIATVIRSYRRAIEVIVDSTSLYSIILVILMVFKGIVPTILVRRFILAYNVGPRGRPGGGGHVKQEMMQMFELLSLPSACTGRYSVKWHSEINSDSDGPRVPLKMSSHGESFRTPSPAIATTRMAWVRDMKLSLWCNNELSIMQDKPQTWREYAQFTVLEAGVFRLTLVPDTDTIGVAWTIVTLHGMAESSVEDLDICCIGRTLKNHAVTRYGPPKATSLPHLIKHPTTTTGVAICEVPPSDPAAFDAWTIALFLWNVNTSYHHPEWLYAHK